MPEGERAWWSAMYRPGVCVSVRLNSRASPGWVHGFIPRYESAAMRQYGGVLPENRVLAHVPGRGVMLFHTIDVLLRHNCEKQPRTRRLPPPRADRAPRMTIAKPKLELVATDSDASYPTVDSQSSSPCSRCDGPTDDEYDEEPRVADVAEPERRASHARRHATANSEATGGRTASGVHEAAGIRKPSSRKTSRGKGSGKRRSHRKESGGQPSAGASDERHASGGGPSGHAAADGQASGGRAADPAHDISKKLHGRKARKGRDGDSA